MASPTALIAWPATAAHRRLRTALMLLNAVPESIDGPALLARLRAAPAGERERLVAFVDVADGQQPGPQRGLRARDLPQLLPGTAQRAAVWLSRTGGAAVSEAERHWARSLGFGGWIGDTASCAAGSELAQALLQLSPRLGLAAVEPAALTRADALVAVGDGHERARAHIRAVTGLAAEAWGRELPRQLPVADRRWRMRLYPDCLVGREVVDEWVRRYGLARGEAVVLGRAAVMLGLVRHVAAEHDFEDEELFYELLDPAEGSELPLAPLCARLIGPGGVAVADRSWHGRSYPRCWVGSEAVDLLVAQYRLKRSQARLALQRLMQLGYFEHVVQEQPLHDGLFFYRFTPEVSS